LSLLSVEDSVKKFYDAHGWKGGEDALFRQFRPAYQPYHAKTEARTLECFKGRSGALLIAGGGDLPQSHLDIANKFSNVTCVDISQIALDIAEQRLPSAQKLLGDLRITGALFRSIRLCLCISRHLSYRGKPAVESCPRTNPSLQARRTDCHSLQQPGITDQICCWCGTPSAKNHRPGKGGSGGRIILLSAPAPLVEAVRK
jgi:hypothetical protein